MSRATIEIDCGYGHSIYLDPHLDGTLTYYGEFFHIGVEIKLDRWSFHDLEIASQYVEMRQDYRQAERGFYHVLYQRGCIKPNYPVPAIRYEAVLDSAVMLRWYTDDDYELPEIVARY